MNMMKLRHKQPLNPYKGQTNNDKNVLFSQKQEFNDDDFRQQGSPHKKNGAATTDQIYKYARILSKFIRNINEDFIDYEAHDGLPRQSHSSARKWEKLNFEPEEQLSYASGKVQQIKQRKQIVRLQSKIQKKLETRVNKSATKKVDQNFEVPNIREYKKKENSSLNSLNNTKSNGIKNIQQKIQCVPIQQKRQKDRSDIAKTVQVTPGLNPPMLNPLLPPSTSATSTTNLYHAQNVTPDLNFPGNIQNYLNLTSLVNQNPLFSTMGGLNLSQMDLNQIMMRFPNQNMIFNSIPVGLNGLNMGMIGLGNNPNLVYQMQKPIINLFNEQVKSYDVLPINREVSNEVSQSRLRNAYPLKRAAYHAAIAYKIYLDKLKNEGQSFEKLQQIDPTKNARKIKMNQSNKTKQPQKKKK